MDDKRGIAPIVYTLTALFNSFYFYGFYNSFNAKEDMNMFEVNYILTFDHNHPHGYDFNAWRDRSLSLNEEGFIPGKKFCELPKDEKSDFSCIGFRCLYSEFFEFVLKYGLNIDYVIDDIVFVSGTIHD